MLGDGAHSSCAPGRLAFALLGAADLHDRRLLVATIHLKREGVTVKLIPLRLRVRESVNVVSLRHDKILPVLDPRLVEAVQTQEFCQDLES